MIKKISIIIPTYNREKCIMLAVNSVINQKKIYDYEIIVSDDGSTDNTKSLFSKNRKNIKYFWMNNGGVNVARNRGIKKSSGDWIIFLDSDDMLSKDAFEIIKKTENDLENINFFGTQEIKTKRKMYKLKKSRKYTYKEWLENEKIKGEFIAVVNRKIFEKDMFDEERFCFEGFFWNRVIKKYGVMAFDQPIRLYSFEQSNRVSRQLLDPKNAEKRYRDYTEYIKRFEKDYKKYNLRKQLSNIYLIAGVYALLSKKTKEGKTQLMQSVKTRPSIKNILTLITSLPGHKFFAKLYKITKVFS